MSDRAQHKLKLLELLLNEEGVLSPDTRQAISRRQNLDEFPLSFAQKRLWFLNHIEPGPHYNDQFDLRLKGVLQIQALQSCLDEIVRRHEALRAHFVMENGEPIQKIAPPFRVPLPLTDLRHLPESERMPRATELAVAEARAPFDLQSGPILRAQLLRLADDDHLLLLTLHHIAIDGWSRGVFLRELTALYPAFLGGNPSPLPPLPIQYADFAVWQQQSMQNEASQLSYWKQQLAGAPALLEWPSDFPRPEVQSHRGARQSFQFPKNLTAALNALAQREGCTLFMTLLAAFQTLAARYTGQDDIVVGTPIANRNRAEIEGLIGAFVNTLALRTNLRGNPTFRQVLARVRETALAAYANQDLPFEKLVEELHPARSQSYNPIFQVMFILQNTPAPVLQSAGLAIRPFEIDSAVAKFDLTLNFEETTDGLSGWIEFSTDLFKPESVTQLIRSYRALLEAAAANPDQLISKLPLIDEAQRQQILVDWNRTEASYPQIETVPQLFEAQVRQNPDAIALTFEGRQLSYEQLNTRANRLAHHLKQQGVGPETLVAICLERSLELVIGLLAILKAGGAYVPLDPHYPAERLAFILWDANVKLLLTQESLLPQVRQLGSSGPAPAVLCLDPELSAIGPQSDANLPQSAKQDNLAYVLYTSGSTGKPKGVQIPHRALTNFLASMAREPGLTASDILLAVTTLSFDIAGLELWLPLTVGAQVVMARTDTARDAQALATQLQQCRATVMQATPATWRMLLESGWPATMQVRDALKSPNANLPPSPPPGERAGVRGLLKILCGGEAWGSDLAEALLHKCSSLWNMYGPTETTIWSAATRVEPGETPSIGKPIANTQFYVLDSQLQPVPIGVAGELHIGGDGLARGYLNRPELTAEKFITDPFRNQTGAKMYKTGDLVRYRGEGKLEFLGRLDHQVKIRGFRIELGEIESVLLKHPNIKEAVVSARGATDGEKRLVAYVVSRQQPPPATAELKTLVSSHLPEYMTPSAFMVLDALPLTPNGKVDRKALPEPEIKTALTASFTAPTTAMEKAIAEIWLRVLRLERVGVHDNFFDLGGHSLLLARVHSQLCDALKINLSIVKLFQYPTISSLAAHLAQPPVESSPAARMQQRARLQREAIARRGQPVRVS